MASLFQDDLRIQRPSTGLGRIHAFAYAKIVSISCVERFLDEEPPAITSDAIQPFEKLMSRITPASSISQKIMNNAFRERRRTFVAEMNRLSPGVRHKLIYDRIMRVKNGDLGEIFSNNRLTAWGVIPQNWILRACATVSDSSCEEKSEFINHMFGEVLNARKSLLRTGCNKCFEIANSITPLTAQDLKHTLGVDASDVDYNEDDAEEALYRYMAEIDVPPPNFVTDILMDPVVRIDGHKLPRTFVVWAMEDLCESMCRGAPPPNEVSICEVIDFVIKCNSIEDKDSFVNWIRISFREGLKCGLWNNLTRTDREVFTYCPNQTANGGEEGEGEGEGEGGEEDEVTSAYTPAVVHL